MHNALIRRLVLGVLALTLVIPSGQFAAWAQDKDKGKEKPAPQAQTAPGFSISVTVPVVNVDVVVTDNNGNYLKDLKKENFRITEDGTVQTITNFAPPKRRSPSCCWWNSASWATSFSLTTRSTGPLDFWALSSPMIGWRWRRSTCAPTWKWTSRTTARSCIQGLSSLYFPPFSESNIFDAVSDVLDRIKDVKGKKAVLVLASGIDTFSRLTLDQTLKRIRETDATIFTVGVAEQFFINQAPGQFGQQLNYISGAESAENVCRDDRGPLLVAAI